MTVEKISSIQCLRGIAALAVVMSHALVNITDPDQARIARFLFISGGSGVDLFFLISGFILVVSTAKYDGTPAYCWNFLVRRTLRIWPAYIAATLLFMLVGYGAGVFLYGPAQERIIKSLLFQPLDYAATAPFFGYAALPVGWTLNYEIYFYAIAAASMLFGRSRWAVLLLWMLLTVVILPAYVAQFTFASSVSHPFSGYANLMANPIQLNFTAGVLIGLAYERLPVNLPRPLLAALVASATIFTAVLLLGRIRPGHGLIYYGLGYVWLLTSLAVAHKGGLPLRTPRALIWLGGISYSLYLVHPMIQYAVPTALQAMQLDQLTTGFGMAIATTSLSIGFAYVFHGAFEIWMPAKIQGLYRRRAHPASPTARKPTAI